MSLPGSYQQLSLQMRGSPNRAEQRRARLDFLGQIQYFGGQAIVLDEKRSVRFQHVHEEV
jgi:hypothetical protein